MSELTNRRRTNIRWKLLTGVSVLALAANAAPVEAADAGNPVVWIEGGWHFDDVQGKNDPFVPPLDALTRAGGFPSITGIENVLQYSYGGEASISFQPENSDWVFSAALRYGRAHGRRRVDQEYTIHGAPMLQYVEYHGSTAKIPTFRGYVGQSAGNNETNAIIDFQAGKDVGLGVFGRNAVSTVSLGARFAEFGEDSGFVAHAAPDSIFQRRGSNIFGHPKYGPLDYHHNSASVAQRNEQFRGIGPSLSWSNSAPFAGNLEDGELEFDWGANAALLFGRQRTKVHHQSTSRYYYFQKQFETGSTKYFYGAKTAITHNHATETRSRRVTVPNVGGFAGISYRYSDAKLSLGYRVDYFFGALDGGVDTRHDITTGFIGPYASISLGLGD